MKPIPRGHDLLGHFLTSSLPHFLTSSAIVILLSAWAPHAQGRPKAAPGLRVHVLDCGTLKGRDGVPYGLPREQVPPRDLSDLCALIAHRRATLQWETG